MANSKTIAGLVGPSLIALAAGLLINLGSMSALVEARRRLKSARIGWSRTGDQTWGCAMRGGWLPPCAASLINVPPWPSLDVANEDAM